MKIECVYRCTVAVEINSALGGEYAPCPADTKFAEFRIESTQVEVMRTVEHSFVIGASL